MKTIEWSKYKRFFAFGCSFTCYLWPAWADLIASEMPDAEYINLGRSGSGNTLISYRIAEANNIFKFTETDLVMVLFTSYTREDRWVPEQGWLTGGNVYCNQIYPKSWVKEFAHEDGYLIRDAAVIDMSMKYLASTPATSVSMLSYPFKYGAEGGYEGRDGNLADKILNIYTDLGKLGPSMHDLVLKAAHPTMHLDYPFKDGHPATIHYYNFLKQLGFNLSDRSTQYMKESMTILRTVPHGDSLPVYFPKQQDIISNSLKLLF